MLAVAIDSATSSESSALCSLAVVGAGSGGLFVMRKSDVYATQKYQYLRLTGQCQKLTHAVDRQGQNHPLALRLRLGWTMTVGVGVGAGAGVVVPSAVVATLCGSCTFLGTSSRGRSRLFRLGDRPTGTKLDHVSAQSLHATRWRHGRRMTSRGEDRQRRHSDDGSSSATGCGGGAVVASGG